MTRFWSKVYITNNGCWPWVASRDTLGYGLFREGSRLRKAHQVAFRLAYGRETTQQVLHRCDTPACVRPSHLFEGTAADNMQDMLRKGRSGRAKLKPAQVVEMKRRRREGEKATALAREYGIHYSTFKDIMKGRVWRAL